MLHFRTGQLAYARKSPGFSRPISFPISVSGRHLAPTGRSGRSIPQPPFRLCGADSKAIRIECRIGGADLNPYLAFAALTAAGLAGIEQKLELEAPYVGDAYQDKTLREVPKTLREATELMKTSKMLRAAFGDEVIDHYVHTAIGNTSSMTSASGLDQKRASSD